MSWTPMAPVAGSTRPRGEAGGMRPPTPAGPARGTPESDRWHAIAWIGVGLILRVLYTLHHRVNSDEPQHLHVSWAEAHGMLAYRDVFDNHSPLFSALMAPLVRALGERADLVLWMRFAMLPIVALSLWATWEIARRLFSRRAALWAVALAAIAPDFLLGSVEYRTDQLWAALWLASLAVLVGGRFTRTRAFGFGAVLGACFGVSMKTSLLMICLAAGGALTLVILARRRASPQLVRLAERALAAIAGLAIVPVGIGAYFAAHRAWGPLYYGAVEHNVVPRLGDWGQPGRGLAAILTIPVVGYAALRLVDSSADRRGPRRALVMAGGVFYFAALNGFWPLITRQDSLPVIPLAAVFVAPLLIAAQERLRSTRLSKVAFAIPAAFAVVEVALALAKEPVWHDRTVDQRRFLAEVLRLTRPGESVMDLKGESIFRPRPYYYALEPITRARMDLGMIPDDISEHLLAAGTPTVSEDSDIYPGRARAFLNQHYIAVGRLRVAGQWLLPRSGDPSAPRWFDAVIPGTYALISSHGPASGRLDGQEYLGPRPLERGRHAFLAAPGEGRIAVVWASAVARGFSPFVAGISR